MKEFEIAGDGIKLYLKENVLAVLSEKPLNTVSSAFHNGGGLKKANAILNVEVLKSYSDKSLHDNPDSYIVESAKKFGVNESFIGMVTAAAVANFSLVLKRQGDLAVSIIATAADNEGNTCDHAESAGEPIQIQEYEGTINIIAVIDGNPTESCLVSTLITITEAKMAALRELDIRSRYSGDEATGTVTDAIVAAETNRGPPIIYAGPASELGQLIGYCTRKAVKEAVTKANEFMPSRSIKDRLREMHLSTARLASELSKIKELEVDEQTLANILENDPLFASVLLAAAKMDEDVRKGLVPSEFGSVEALSKRFGGLLLAPGSESDGSGDYGVVDLPPFTKQVLISIVKDARSGNK
jgi:adenosylcobinamide hydrolase